MTLSDVADVTHLGWDTVKDIVKEHLRRDYGRPKLQGVRYLGIDEIYLGSRKGYFTIVADLEDGQILWVGKSRGQAALRGFWRRLRLAKTRIKAVAMDLSGAYASAVLEHLPEAALVFDRFHLMKLMNERLDDLRRQLVREAEGVFKKKIKGTRFLLLRNFDNLKPEQIPKLDEALALNEPLLLAWYLKEELRELWRQSSAKAMKAFLEDWCAKAAATGIGQLQKMAKTLRVHAWGILNYAKHALTTGKLEGINNKIKTLTKKSYGFHDEQFFVLKLFSLHHSKYKLVG